MKSASGQADTNANWMSCCDPSLGSNVDISTMQTRSERAGIGIILALSPDGSLYVHTVCPGGSAEGQLEPGDILLKIGTEDIYRAPAPYVAELLLGPPGTEILLWVRRSSNDGAAENEVSFRTQQFQLKRKRTDPQLARRAIREAFEDHSQIPP
mmetsp:Transcript_35070/g.56644  ORF Transcript_35070/g.56644 Transcript_35070/m.56644 type:complete len:154 (+) Transcript_35070:195-656(+)